MADISQQKFYLNDKRHIVRVSYVKTIKNYSGKWLSSGFESIYNLIG